MDYDVALRLKNVESNICNINVKLRGGLSKFTVSDPSSQAPIFFALNKDFWSEN